MDIFSMVPGVHNESWSCDISMVWVNGDILNNRRSWPTGMCRTTNYSFFCCQMHKLFKRITKFNWTMCYVVRSMWPWIPDIPCSMTTHGYVIICLIIKLKYKNVRKLLQDFGEAWKFVTLSLDHKLEDFVVLVKTLCMNSIDSFGTY